MDGEYLAAYIIVMVIVVMCVIDQLFYNDKVLAGLWLLFGVFVTYGFFYPIL